MSKESKTYKNMPKKIYIRTFGCQMNVRDTEIIAGLLLDAGFKVKDRMLDNIDVVLLVTCSVRQHAEEKVWSEIGRLSKLRSKPIIGLIGCMAENYKDEAFKRVRGIDLVVGTNNIGEIPVLLKKIIEKKTQFVSVAKDKRDEFVYKSKFRQERDHAYVIISEGCNNFCSYCVVPYVRGMLRNRNHENLLEEIKNNIDKGIKHITLLGQNVNAYCSNNRELDFIELLERVNSLKGLKKLTFVTSHPKDASNKLFEAIARLENVEKYLHLPVQSGSNRILTIMNRNYTRQHYIYLVDEYRKIVPHGVLSTDVIVGFPSETEKDFQDTLDLIKRVKFNNAYIFKYSPRPHTKAYKYVDDVSKEEKERRHGILLKAQKKIAEELKNERISPHF